MRSSMSPRFTTNESGIGGAYHAVFKGRGMEFAEVREYQPGDDVRWIDWNVSARMNETYVKQFEEERERMFTKMERIASAIAWRLQRLEALPQQTLDDE